MRKSLLSSKVNIKANIKVNTITFVITCAVAAIVLFLASTTTANAATILNDTEVYIGSDKTYEENLYVGAGKTIIEGDITEDLVVVGGEITVAGNVTGDVFLVGGSALFKGNVFGDLRVIGGTVQVEGIINGDVLIVGGDVNLNENAEINREIFIIGGDVAVRDDINTKLKIIAANVKLSAAISGSVEVTTQRLIVGRDANIAGGLTYYAPQKFTTEEGGTVTGTISYNEIKSIRDTGFVKQAIVSFMSFWFLLRFITTLIIAFILIYVFKVFSQGVNDLALQSFWKSFLAGILVILVTPLVIGILFISLFALPIGFLLALALTFVAIIAPAVSGIFVGNWAKKYINKTYTGVVDLQGAALGVVVLTLLQFVPVAGDLIRVVVAIVAIGAVARYIRLAIVK